MNHQQNLPNAFNAEIAEVICKEISESAFFQEERIKKKRIVFKGITEGNVKIQENCWKNSQIKSSNELIKECLKP